MVTDKEYAEVLGLTEKDHQRIREGQAGVFQGDPQFSNYKNANGVDRESLDRKIAHHFKLKTEEDKRTEAVSESAHSAATSAKAAQDAVKVATDALAEAKTHRRVAQFMVVVSVIALVVSVIALFAPVLGWIN